MGTVWVVEAFISYDYEGEDFLHIASGEEAAMKDLFSSVTANLVGKLKIKKDLLKFFVEPTNRLDLSGDERGIRAYPREDVSEKAIRKFLGY